MPELPEVISGVVIECESDGTAFVKTNASEFGMPYNEYLYISNNCMPYKPQVGERVLLKYISGANNNYGLWIIWDKDTTQVQQSRELC